MKKLIITLAVMVAIAVYMMCNVSTATSWLNGDCDACTQYFAECSHAKILD